MTIFGLPEEEYFTVGHRACAGCGEAIAIRLITKAAGKNSILVESTGCMEVISTPYPETSWKLPWIHGAFENNSSIGSGVSAALKMLGKEDTKVIVFGGDGASYDIGIGCISGAFERGDNITYICTDNEAYMNTGIQRSGATPLGASTTTSPDGSKSIGKQQWKKDLMHILAAHSSPYLAQASIGYLPDAFQKLKKAMEIKGPTFVNLMCTCVPGWRTDPAISITVAKLGVDTGVTPIYEIINGKHKVTRPRDVEKLKPLEEYLKLQGRFKHLLKPENKPRLELIQKQVKENLAILLEHESKGL
ncbi:MAG: thiamine pyrophosphate-dependent enzyme [Candidatus Altiarchaeota archaeon]